MARSFAELQALAADEPDTIVAYGDKPLQFAEIWQPPAAADGSPGKAVVVLIHGGCWQNTFDVSHIRALAGALKVQGYLVWAIEYRRIGDSGGGWLGTFEDVALAVDRAGQAAVESGLRVVVAGHSAGGQLALWAAARASLRPGNPFHEERAFVPDAVLGLAAITDLQSYAAGSSSCERSTVELLGGTPAQVPERYQATSPLVQLPLGVPVALVQGMADSIVPVSQAQSYLEAALSAGDRVRLRCVPAAGHFDLIYPGTLACQAALATLRELL